MMTVSEIANRTGVTADVVRYYTRLGLIIPRRGSNGYRYYNYQHVRYLNFINQAKLLGFTLKEIRSILIDAEAGNSVCALVRNTLKQRIKETSKTMLEIAQLQTRMEKALQRWESIPDAKPDDVSICVLIESVTEE